MHQRKKNFRSTVLTLLACGLLGGIMSVIPSGETQSMTPLGVVAYQNRNCKGPATWVIISRYFDGDSSLSISLEQRLLGMGYVSYDNQGQCYNIPLVLAPIYP